MSFLDSAIGWLAPARCIVCGLEGLGLCAVCTASEIIPFGNRCWRCESLSPNSKTCQKCRTTGSPLHVWIATDYEAAAKHLIHQYKFGHLRASADSVSRIMHDKIQSDLSDIEIKSLNYLVVPVPTASSRVRERGFDHASLLARKVASLLNADTKNALGRSGNSRQVGAKRSDRIKQAQDIYFVRSNVAGRNILLIDDIVTTGATICAASRELRKAGADRVDALLFAKKR